MEYVVNGEVIRETGCLFRGEVNDVMTAGKVWSEDDEEKKYVILKVNDEETSRKLAGIISQCNRRELRPFSIGDSYCVLSPYMKKREVKDYVYTMTKMFDEVVDICREIVRKVSLVGIPDPIKYLILKERKINIDEEGKIYFTYDLDLSKLDETAGEKECARECGYIIEELIGDEKYSEFIIVKLIKQKNSHGCYETLGDVMSDIKNMKLLARVPKRFDGIKDFFLKYGYIIVKVVIIIGIIIICAAGIKYLLNVLDINNNSFDIIGTENLAKP